MVELDVLVPAPGIRYGFWKGLVLSVYGESPSIAQMRSRRPRLQRLARAWPGQLTALSVIEAGSPDFLPSASIRRETQAQLNEFGDQIIRAAVVIERDDVVARLARPLFRGVMVASQKRFPSRFFADATAAFDWLAADPAPYSAAEVAVVLARVRNAS